MTQKLSVTPLRAVTDEERLTFERDGVVRLQKILPDDWVDHLRQAMEDVYHDVLLKVENPMERLEKQTLAQGGRILTDLASPKSRFFIKNSPGRLSAALHQFTHDSPLKLIAADLYRSEYLNFFFDQMFWKEPGSGRRTAFHQDLTYFNCTGNQCATFWVAIDPVTKATGAMGYVRGSHKWGREFAPNVFVSQDPLPGGTGEPMPDIEGNEKDYDIVYHDSEPGDVLVHDYRTVHGATGNTSIDTPRRSYAVRYTGDDVRFYKRPGTSSEAPFSPSLKDGDRLESAEFPIVWKRPPS